MSPRHIPAFMVSVAIAAVTMTGCNATVAGTPLASSPATSHTEGTPLSTPTSTPSATLTLPSELDDFVVTTDFTTSTPQLFAQTTMNARSWSRALGVTIPVPAAIPRTDPSPCLIEGRLARTCGTAIEYDVEQLQRDRSDFGDLVVVLIAAHETGHLITANAGGDTASTSDDDREARANCFAGAYLSTNPAITPADAGTAFQHTPLPRAGQGSYTAFQRGFTVIREGVNPVSTCVAVTG